MKFVQFSYKSRPENICLGYIDDDCIVDLNAQDTDMPKTMLEFLQNDYFWKRIKDLKQRRPVCTIAQQDVYIRPPIHGMDKILAILLNYNDYCEKHKVDVPEVPVVYNKFPSTIIGPNDFVQLRTAISTKYDFEVELCVVIGRIACGVKAEEALRYVFGYTIAQDICSRDWQKNEYDFLLGSAMDTSCPIGPHIITRDEIGDVNKLKIRCSVNGELKQSGNTANLLYKIPELIERISSVMTLYPGDLILTGTPAGVGMYCSPPQYLKPGDVILSQIEKIGFLETKCTAYIPPERIPRHKEIRWPY